MQKSKNIEKQNEFNEQKEGNKTGKYALQNLAQKISDGFFEVY
jgi:hypothetical protein